MIRYVITALTLDNQNGNLSQPMTTPPHPPSWVPVVDVAARMGMTAKVFADAYLNLSDDVRHDSPAPPVATVDGRVCVDVTALRTPPPDTGQAHTGLLYALEFWIAARGLTGEWIEFRDGRVPLICARRGNPVAWRRRSIDMHNVVVRLSWMPEILWSLAQARREFLAPAQASTTTVRPTPITLSTADDLARAELVLDHVPAAVDRVRALAATSTFLTPVTSVTPLLAPVSPYADDVRGRRRVSHTPSATYALGPALTPVLTTTLHRSSDALITEVTGD